MDYTYSSLTIDFTIFSRGCLGKVLRRPPTPSLEVSPSGEGDGGSSSSRRRYERQVLIENIEPSKALKTPTRDREPIITYFRGDTINVLPRNNDPIVITIQYVNWYVKRVLIELGSSTYIMFWSTSQGNQLDPIKFELSKNPWLAFQARSTITSHSKQHSTQG